MRFLIIILSLFVGGLSLAESGFTPALPHSLWSLNVGLGYILNSTSDNHTTFIILPAEEDELNEQQNASLVNYYAGINRTLWENPQNILQAIDLGLSYYYTNLHSKGDVYQYADPNFNNYNYNMQRTANNLMLESRWFFGPLQYIKPFILVGTGVGFTSFQYGETAKPTAVASPLNLGTNHQSKWAYDVGLGTVVTVLDPLSFTLQYLYLGNGDIKSNGRSGNNVLARPIQKAMNFSEAMVALNYHF